MLKNFSKIILVGILGFCSGFPLLLTSVNLQLWQASINKPLTYVGALSLLGLPYILKWLWAPLVDRLMFRHNWIRLLSSLLVFLIYNLAMADPNSIFCLIFASAIAIISATLDVAIDAYKVDFLNKESYGLGVASNLFGYRLGMIVSGGGGLVIAGLYGWKISYLFASAIMFLNVLLLILLPKITTIRVRQDKIKQQLLQTLNEFNQHQGLLWWFILILFYRVGDAMISNLGGPFLLDHCKLTLDQIGVLYKVFSVIATLLGSFITGILMQKISLRNFLIIGSVLQILGVVPFLILAHIHYNVPYFLVAFAVVGDGVCSGCALTVLTVLFMRWCNKNYVATQLAIFTAIAAIARVLFGFVFGFLAESYGWGFLFDIGLILTTIPLWVLLFRLRPVLLPSFVI